MTSELRQLRRVRWGVRLTLALGISASLAANILHANHVLIDQIISGWPPVAVFATIEAIARVPIRRRWLAGIRMTGLGFVAGIAFWVSYWHMASVAAAHGENGSKYLLPLSVDGLVVVASISLVELTGQITAVEATARAAAHTTITEPNPAAPPPAVPLPVVRAPADQPSIPVAPLPLVPVPGSSTAPPDRPWPPDSGLPSLAAPSTAPAAAAPVVPPVEPATTLTAVSADDDRAEPLAAAARPARPTLEEPAPSTADTPASATDPGVAPAVRPAGDTADIGDQDTEVPPDNPSEAVIWWRGKDPTLSLRQIAAKVGRSERTVRRILYSAPTDAAPAEPPQPQGTTAVSHRPTNGAALDDLAASVVSSN